LKRRTLRKPAANAMSFSGSVVSMNQPLRRLYAPRRSDIGSRRYDGETL
jgi:hypothetical protein